MNDRCAAGLEDVRFSAASLEWLQPLELGGGVRVYHLPPAAPNGMAHAELPAVRVYDGPNPVEADPHDGKPPRRTV